MTNLKVEIVPTSLDYFAVYLTALDGSYRTFSLNPAELSDLVKTGREALLQASGVVDLKEGIDWEDLTEPDSEDEPELPLDFPEGFELGEEKPNG